VADTLILPPKSDILHTDPHCRPLLRLRQLAEEIASALERNDLDIVERATALLPSAMEQCGQMEPSFIQRHEEVRLFVYETHHMLTQCDETLQSAMISVATELRRLRLAHKNREWVQQQEYAVVGKRLDTSR